MPGSFAPTLRGNAGMITKHRRGWVRHGTPAALIGSLPVRFLKGTCNAACTADPASSTYLSTNGMVQWIRAAPSLLSRCIFVVCRELRDIDDYPFCNPGALVALKLFAGP